MINIKCIKCGCILPLTSNDKKANTIMNTTIKREKNNYPDVYCPNCLRTLIEGKRIKKIKPKE